MQDQRRVTVSCSWFLAGILVVSSALGSCQFDNRFREVPESICVSGEIWTYTDKDSPLMNPGRSCVGCHAETNDPEHAPLYQVAGTVMDDVAEDDDCRGAASLTVVITDALGEVHEVPTNTAGNFWLDPSVELALPYSAMIIDAAGNVSSMQTPVSDGDCAACHTREGANGARGRLVPPALAVAEEAAPPDELAE
jgi:hypothetical protein